jgi:hypothetical protein
LNLKSAAKEVDEIREEDESDDYQGSVDSDEDDKSERIQV